jgi:hypothetical protein
MRENPQQMNKKMIPEYPAVNTPLRIFTVESQSTENEEGKGAKGRPTVRSLGFRTCEKLDLWRGSSETIAKPPETCADGLSSPSG